MSTHVRHGTSPLLFTIPHNGRIRIPGAAIRQETAKRDKNTLLLATAIRDHLQTKNISATLMWFDLHRSHVDCNRGPDFEPFAEGFEHDWMIFHRLLHTTIETLITLHGRLVHLDIHGCSLPDGPDIIPGTDFHTTSPRNCDQIIRDVLEGRHCTALGRAFQVVHSPDETRGMHAGFSGRYIVQSVARRWNSFALDTVQLEFNRPLRQVETIDEVASHLAVACSALL